MMLRTHFVIGLALGLFFISDVTYKISFIPIVIIASILPDIDLAESYLGRKWYFRPLQWFTQHRGIVHSMTLCLLISILFAIFIPFLALPFFLGYSFHLLSDSFTVDGIKPFWPLSREINGRIRVGGRIEEGLYYGFILVNIVILIVLVMRLS